MRERWNESLFVCAYFLPLKRAENKIDRARLVKFHFCQFTEDMDMLNGAANGFHVNPKKNPVSKKYNLHSKLEEQRSFFLPYFTEF